jgi:hypothetical protein
VNSREVPAELWADDLEWVNDRGPTGTLLKRQTLLDIAIRKKNALQVGK